jgi:hypothetical protein
MNYIHSGPKKFYGEYIEYSFDIDKYNIKVAPRRHIVKSIPKVDNIIRPTGFRVYGLLSASAYEKPNDRQAFLDKNNMGDYVINYMFNDNETICAINNKKNELVILFRGTSLTSFGTSFQDLTSDIEIGLSVENFVDARYYKSLSTAKKIIKMFSSYNVVFAGHSLGSHLAYYISKKLNYPSYNFALPSSLYQLSEYSKITSDIFDLIKPTKFIDKFVFCVRGDPIGEMGMHSTIKAIKQYVPAKTYNLHSVFNFC